MQSLLIVSHHAPFQHAAREALDLALASAAFGVPVGILFMNDGVLQLLKGQDAAQAQQKSLAANLQALPLFGVEDLMVCQHSLTERGLQVRQCQLDVRSLSSAEITSLLEHYDQVVNL